jgi:hypothetical protein
LRLERPTAIGVHLRPLRLRPALGHPAAADRVFLAPREPRPARLNHAGVDDLPAHGEVAGVPQGGIEPGEQAPDGAGPGQLLAIEPDRLGVGDGIVQRESHEAHDREPVADLVFGLVVRERIERLHHKDLEHQHRVVRRPATPGPVRARERHLQLAPKQLEVDDHRQSLKRVPRRRQPRIPLIQIKKSRLTRHARLPATTYGRESRPALIR